MSTELEVHREPQSTLAYQIEQARTLAAAPLLPAEYRNQPANVLIAMNLGQAMGLSPAESLYRIAVIKGKPTASAELIASNVRKAGHRLRVVIDEQAVSATATIVRSDDPDFEFAVTRDMKWAQAMGLASNDNYKKQPLTMLANRAITAAARLACPETLYGVAYSPDEMYEAAEARPQRGGLGAVLNPDPSPAQDAPASEPPAPPAGGTADEGDRDGPASAGEDSPTMFDYRSGWARGTFFPAIRAVEEADPDFDAKAFMSEIVGRTVTSSKELLAVEAQLVYDNLPHDDALPIEGELVGES